MGGGSVHKPNYSSLPLLLWYFVVCLAVLTCSWAAVPKTNQDAWTIDIRRISKSPEDVATPSPVEVAIPTTTGLTMSNVNEGPDLHTATASVKMIANDVSEDLTQGSTKNRVAPIVKSHVAPNRSHVVPNRNVSLAEKVDTTTSLLSIILSESRVTADAHQEFRNVNGSKLSSGSKQKL